MASLENIAKAIVVANPSRQLGPLVIALGVDSYLMGMIGNQFFRYVMTTEHEARHIRFIVYFATTVAAVTTCFIWAWEMHLFTYNYGKYAQFISQRWCAWLSLLCPLTKVTVQGFYVERAWRINHCNRWLLGVLITLLIPSAVGSIAYAFLTFRLDTPEMGEAAKVFFYLWPSACIAADTITTSSILWGLYHSRTGWNATDMLVVKLMRVSVEAQIPPTIFAAVVLMVWSNKMSPISILFVIILPKLYLTGALSVLNSRDTIRRKGSTFYTDTDFSSKSHSKHQQESVSVSTQTFVECSPSAELPRLGLNRSLAEQMKHPMEDLESGISLPALSVNSSKDHVLLTVR
nr:hypothetical protein L204_00578 [Cryptococcus depauperatus CBS 7855]